MTVDVEALLVAALSPVLGVPVATMTPNPRPVAFVRVVAAGGPARAQRVLDWADVMWEAWSSADDTGEAASALAGRVRDEIDDLVGATHNGAFVVDASATRPRSFRDDISGTPRYVGQARLLIHANN
ncbi:hypothetical protein ACSDQ9_05775 [Aestuariimicrobium soli]|uniref:hypothetical protein n=1 Tax=Aestuariimicrobium soli TaxID=2035834 RepID=UPI003EB8C4BA